MEVSSHEDSASEFCCVGPTFSISLLGFVSKAIKLLLTELVGQCRNILPLRSVHTIQFFHPIILQPTFQDNNWMCERQFLTSFRHFLCIG